MSCDARRCVGETCSAAPLPPDLARAQQNAQQVADTVTAAMQAATGSHAAHLTMSRPPQARVAPTGGGMTTGTWLQAPDYAAIAKQAAQHAASVAVAATVAAGRAPISTPPAAVGVDAAAGVRKAVSGGGGGGAGGGAGASAGDGRVYFRRRMRRDLGGQLRAHNAHKRRSAKHKGKSGSSSRGAAGTTPPPPISVDGDPEWRK